MAADGGYASLANLNEAKARKVKDMAFHKKRGLTIENMVESPWVYRKLGNFEASDRRKQESPGDSASPDLSIWLK